MNSYVKYGGRWILEPVREGNGRIRLFCFPFAGGGASYFTRWIRLFPDFVSLVPVQLPGRENRLDEELATDANVLIDDIVKVLEPYYSAKFAFWGHSMGGLLAARVCNRIKEAGWDGPVHLFLSSVGTPDFARENNEALGVDRLVIHSGGVPDAVRSNEELMRIFKNTARQDCDLVRSLSEKDINLPVPVSLLCGRNDSLVPLERMLSWQGFCSGGFESRIFDGDHFFITKFKRQVVDYISDILMMHLL